VPALLSISEGIHHILAPEPIGGLLMNFIVLGLAIIFECFSRYFAIKKFRHVKGKRGLLGGRA
jgi:hypothetical protein